jgi:prepilin-type N-terminal cleavage/methylation domain-containing protein
MISARSKIAKGFTLIELLVVIGILAILLTIVLIAINPGRQFAQANNTKRHNDVLQILNTVHEYAADNHGNLPTALRGLTAGTAYEVGSGAGNADICSEVMPTYISALPTDPFMNTSAITACAAYDTGYEVTIDTNNRVTISAPHTDTTVEPGGVVIAVTR